MNRRQRCGQAALEYLLTYGWAILAVLIAVGGLTYFTQGFGAWAPDICTADPPFACVEHRVDEDGTVLLGIQNGGADLASAVLTLACDAQPPVNETYATSGVTRASDRLNGSLVRLGCPVVSGRFDARFSIVYQANGESALHESNGRIGAKAEG